MTGFRPLLRKDLLHQIRSFRLWVTLAVFGAVGIGSPLLTWVTPKLLASLPEEEMAGLELLMLQEPSATDALLQYLGNFGMLPILVLLLSMGAIAGEAVSGTAGIVLSKPVSRTAFLLAKATSAMLVYGVAFVLGAVGCLALVVGLFGPVHLGGYAALHGLLFLHLLVHLALALAASAFAPTRLAAGGWAFAGWIALTILGALPRVGGYTPGGLTFHAGALIDGSEPSGLPLGVAVSLASALALLLTADLLLRRRAV